MLFVALCNVKAGSTTKARLARRVPFQFPAGLRVLGEYWLPLERPNNVLIVESDSIAPIIAAIEAWDDQYEITVVPALTAEEGLALAKGAGTTR